MTSKRWAAALCSVVVGLTGSGPAAGATPPASVGPGGHVRPRAAVVTIASYNVRARLSPRQAVADLRELTARGADILALQEMGGGERRAAVRARLVDCGRCRLGAAMPPGPARGATPVLFRRDRFVLLHSRAVRLTPRSRLGRPGAGPDVTRARYADVVKLRERRTGRVLFVLNSHAVPSVQDKRGGPNRSQPRRLALYRQHMHGLRRLVRELRAPGVGLFVTGDLNVNYRRDRRVRDPHFPYFNLHRVRLRSSYEPLGAPRRGTHVRSSGRDSRLIDYVYFLPRRHLVPLSQRVLTGYRSDHRPLVVRFRLLGPGRR